jgi:hypothetical protein
MLGLRSCFVPGRFASTMQTPPNPYSPPAAAVADASSQPPGRPALVWIIVVLMIIGSLASAVSLVLRLAGRMPDVGGINQLMHWYDHVMALIIALVRVIAAIALFRLKPSAWPWFAGLFAASIAMILFHLAAKPAYRALLEQMGYWGVAGGLALNGAMAYYVYRLHRDGVLRN